MKKYLKYFKSILIIIISILIFNIINSTLYYFNISNSKTINYINLFTTLLSFFIGGYYIGNKSLKKGWLEGIKIGLIGIFLFFLISYLGFDNFKIKTLIYYFMILSSCVLGGILGINKKKKS